MKLANLRDAISKNKECFRDKVVLDVGAGSGILSIWAAKAGAKKVIACEFTAMADHARNLVEANGLADVVDVRRSAVETLGLEKDSVDIIISEWMGYFLLRESMLDSVLYARDAFLKPCGAIYPNRASLYWAPAALQGDRDAKLAETAEGMADWDAFEDAMMREHDVDVRCLRMPYETEQVDYHLRQAVWYELRDDQLAAPPCRVASFDLYTCTRAEAAGVSTSSFSFPLPLDRVAAFAGWFDCHFEGSASDPARHVVELNTSPADGYTHWGQQVFYVSPSAIQEALDAAGRVPFATKGTIALTRQKGSVRLYDVNVTLDVVDDPAAQKVDLSWELS